MWVVKEKEVAKEQKQSDTGSFGQKQSELKTTDDRISFSPVLAVDEVALRVMYKLDTVSKIPNKVIKENFKLMEKNDTFKDSKSTSIVAHEQAGSSKSVLMQSHNMFE